MWWGLFAAEYVIIPITASEFSQYGAYVYAKEVLPRLTRSTKVRTLGFLLGNVHLFIHLYSNVHVLTLNMFDAISLANLVGLDETKYEYTRCC